LDTVAERDGLALSDRPHPGGSTRLTDEPWTELTATPRASPSQAGYDEPAWTPQLVRDHIADAFDVEYSLAHIYHVMKRGGCLTRQPGCTTTRLIQLNNGDDDRFKK